MNSPLPPTSTDQRIFSTFSLSVPLTIAERHAANRLLRYSKRMLPGTPSPRSRPLPARYPRLHLPSRPLTLWRLPFPFSFQQCNQRPKFQNFEFCGKNCASAWQLANGGSNGNPKSTGNAPSQSTPNIQIPTKLLSHIRTFLRLHRFIRMATKI